jgi:Ca2+-binding RTX toxin-like protein
VIVAPAADVVHARGGDDVICGNAAFVYGEAGDDRVEIPNHSDGTITVPLVLGGKGDDEIHREDTLPLLNTPRRDSWGGPGNDRLFGGPFPDKLKGGPGSDLLVQGLGDSRQPDNATLSGGAGADVLIGGRSRDSLHGGLGPDRLLGGVGGDFLHGDRGDDVILGGSGADKSDGSFGNDRILGQRGIDSADGGPGTDRCWAESVRNCMP